jgi:ADP-ribose pyrophosphatase YjhB (NUDIX family)
MGIQVTVDLVIFTVQESALKVWLVKRDARPFKGRLAIPQGIIHKNESLDQAALRELKEETRARQVYLEQLYSFGDRRRDPRGRVVTVAYYALVPGDQANRVSHNGSGAAWRSVDELPPLVFDQKRIVNYAVERLRTKLEYTTAGFQLLPRKFTLSELQAVYETILGKRLDKRNFRKKMDLLGVLKPLREWRRTGRKPARLYVFKGKKFEKLKDKGILFPF